MRLAYERAGPAAAPGLPAERLQVKNMPRIEVEYPDELLPDTRTTRPEIQRHAQEALLVGLYALGQLSSGRAAELLHTSRREFLELLDRYGVSLFDENIDLEAESRRGR